MEGTRVVIKKGKKGFEGKEWAPKFSRGCIVTWTSGFWIFKTFHQKLVIKEGSDECIDFSKDPIDIPMWDRRTAQNYFDANVLKQAGKVEIVSKVPIVFYIALIMMGIMLFIQLAGSRIRI